MYIRFPREVGAATVDTWEEWPSLPIIILTSRDSIEILIPSIGRWSAFKNLVCGYPAVASKQGAPTERQTIEEFSPTYSPFDFS